MGKHRAEPGWRWQPPGKLGEPDWEFDSDRWGDAILLAVILFFAILGVGGIVLRFAAVW